MQENAIDRMLEEYAGNRAEIGITLKDATFIKGIVKSFDGYVVLMEGEPGELIYRHSILKLASPAQAKAQPAPVRQAETAEKKPQRFERFAAAPQKKKLPPRPRPERQPERRKEEAPEHLGSLGEEMLKWLKSQKGQ